MQSTFLLKSIISCMLIINVTLCRSSFTAAFCNARCYWSHSGFDYGYLDNGQCKCAPPTVYVFNGMGRDLSDEYIDTSLKNNKLVEKTITRYERVKPVKPVKPVSTKDIDDLNDGNAKMWKEIVDTITKKYTFIKEPDLEHLKNRITDDATTMKYLIIYLRTPLENALEEVKKIKPYTADECDELLTLLRRRNRADEEERKSKKSTAGPNAPRPSVVRGKSIPVGNADVARGHGKSTGNDRKEQRLQVTQKKPATTSVNDERGQKIFVRVSEKYYVDDDGRAARRAKQNAAEKKALADAKEREANGSWTESGSYEYVFEEDT